MIAKLKGKIDDLKPTELILDVNNVGYHLSIPISTYEKIYNEIEISLHVYTLHKEDQFRLFGFFTEEEKELFSILINISGIGPSIALSILSGITIERLIDSVKTNKLALLTKIPGIGKSKAEKLIFELKRRSKKLDSFTIDSKEVPTARNDAVEALVSLGFDESKSYSAIEQVLNENPDFSIEEIIKEALKLISG
ncbi:Holliday junction branch migration protein RuvA [Spirochaetota bacterium]